jgi:hypothetical protein
MEPKIKEILFGEAVKSWTASRMEHDKSLITLSWGGIVAAVTPMIAANRLGLLTIFALSVSVFLFALALLDVLKILRANTKYLEDVCQALHTNEQLPTHSPELAKLDERAKKFFLAALLVAWFGGLAEACSRWHSPPAQQHFHSHVHEVKGGAVTQKQDKPNAAEEYLRESVDGFGKMAPVQKSPAPTPPTPQPTQADEAKKGSKP